MRLMDWLRGKASCRVDSKYDAAMRLADDVTEKMRAYANSPDPFKAWMAGLFLQRRDLARSAATAIETSAFEEAQEANIFRGPPPPKKKPQEPMQ